MQQSKSSWWLLGAFGFGLTLLLYARTLTLPYFWDDVPNFLFTQSRSFLDIWVNNRGFPYYRPAFFTLWKLLFEVAHPSTWVIVLHGLSVSLHALSAVALGWLVFYLCPSAWATPLWGRYSTADVASWLAALGFAAYPFAALNTAYVAGQFHSGVTLAGLFTIGAVLRWCQTQARHWLVLGCVGCLLTPFIHEAGVVVGTLSAWVILVWSWSRRPAFKWLALFPLLSALFLPIWLSVPKDQGSGFIIQRWDEYFASLTFFSQALTYPVQLIPQRLINRGWWDLAAIWLVNGTVTALILGVMCRLRFNLLRPIGVALGWVAITLLPSVIVLSFAYIAVSQRLLYFVGPGGVMIWALVLAGGLQHLRSTVGRTVGLVIGLIFLLLPSSLSVWRSMDLHDYALRPINQLISDMQPHRTERQLVVNGTYWVNLVGRWYALGHDGVNVAAGYAPLDTVVSMNSPEYVPFERVTFPNIKLETTRYYIATDGPDIDVVALASRVLAYDRIWAGTFTDEQAWIEPVGRVQAGASEPPEHYVARFGEGIFLEAAQLKVAADFLHIDLRWKYLGPDPNATVFRHILDCEGALLVQGDGDLLGRMLPFGLLPLGATVDDWRQIPTPASSTAGCYRLGLGLFTPSGERVPAFAPDGIQFVNEVVVIEP